jgi:hypothetical protein
LLTYTEDFANAIWTKQTATVSGTIITPTGGGSAYDNRIYQLFNVVAGTTYAISVRAKGTGKITIAFHNLAGQVFDLTSEYQTFTLTYANLTTVPRNVNIYAGEVTFSTGAVISSNAIDVLWVQAETGSTATNYQKVVTSHDVTEVGVPEVRYLQYATSRWMETNAVDFSGTGEMTVVWGGRKVSDATIGTLVELSVGSGVQNGSFMITAGGQASAGAKYGSTLRGTALVYADTPASFSSPSSNVLSLIENIGQTNAVDEMMLRINGAAQTLTIVGANAGTGNYGSHKLYFGARAGTSLFGNHEENFIFIRGATTPVFYLEQLENIAASKLGIADFHLENMIRIPASLTNPGFDILGNPLTNPPRVGLNGAESTVNFSPVDNSWSDVYSIPGADLPNYGFNGVPGDLDILIDTATREAKFRLENQ